ncbi:MAG: 2-phosphosulfolactate phosphatase [Caldicoprobacterales bacterium]|jgi:2-phosphosulfolactate phosphatase|nr:2-phosphosulfolactate phosphatase [Clostridia bacterium]MDI9512654.1 2-phosphosulfolactate phosphatase [Bacillota bacterium]NLH58088.1 2-phosphosulfolactate phosphatase [Clostridiales bacterium]
MKLSSFATPDTVTEKDFKDKVVVVIDVLRASSTMIAALHNGCKEIIPVTEIEEAVNMSKNYDKDSFLLCGERNTLPIEGFDLSNSPLEYKREIIEGKTLLLTTTNGTRAINMSSDASTVLICSMINIDATVDYIVDQAKDTIFVCAGTNGRFTLDDCLTAGAAISRIKKRIDVELDDLSIISSDAYDFSRGKIHERLRDTFHYKRMKELGLTADLDYCLTENIAPIVGVYMDGVVKRLDR